MVSDLVIHVGSATPPGSIVDHAAEHFTAVELASPAERWASRPSRVVVAGRTGGAGADYCDLGADLAGVFDKISHGYPLSRDGASTRVRFHTNRLRPRRNRNQ